MGKVADKIASRVQSMSVPSDASAEASAAPAEALEASVTEEPVPVEGDAPATIEEAIGDAPAATSEPEDEVTLRKRILAEKLEASRERRRAAKEERELRAHEGRTKQQIDAELEAARSAKAQAEAERAKWERLKVGSFREGLKELGRDPLKTFEELEREAAEANTPEGKIARLQEQYETTISELTKRIDALVSERDEERKTSEERDLISRFESDFGRQIQDAAYRSLRVAYEDEELLAFAHGFRQEPKRLHHAAKLHGIRLTNPQAGFTMREILTVLAAAQDAYDGKRKAREARLSGESGDQRVSHKVNGATAPEAVSTIGTELASTRASAGETRRLSRKERIEREVERLETRR